MGIGEVLALGSCLCAGSCELDTQISPAMCPYGALAITAITAVQCSHRGSGEVKACVGVCWCVWCVLVCVGVCWCVWCVHLCVWCCSSPFGKASSDCCATSRHCCHADLAFYKEDLGPSLLYLFSSWLGITFLLPPALCIPLSQSLLFPSPFSVSPSSFLSLSLFLASLFPLPLFPILSLMCHSLSFSFITAMFGVMVSAGAPVAGRQGNLCASVAT